MNVLLFSLLVALLEWYIREKHPEWARQAIREVIFSDLYNHTMRPYHEEVLQYQDMVLERHYNSWGMSEPREPTVPKPADVYRVLVMGDSFMQSPSVDDSVAGTLERRLSGLRTADGKRIEVLNGGQSSYSALLHLARFKHQYRLLDPDAVIFSPDLTDVYDDQCRYRRNAVYDAKGDLERVGPGLRGPEYQKRLEAWGYYSIPLYSYRWLLGRLAFALSKSGKSIYEENDACRDLFAHAAGPMESLSKGAREALAFSLSSIGKFIDEVRGKGIHLFVFMYPHQEQITGTFNRAYEYGTESLCREKGVPFKSFFYNMAYRYAQGFTIYVDGDMHYNTDGYRFLAEDVSAYILSDTPGTLGVALK